MSESVGLVFGDIDRVVLTVINFSYTMGNNSFLYIGS